MRWIIGLICGCLGFGALAQSTYEYRLQNGLKLIVQEDHRAPVVFSSVWYKVGGSYENDGITGISHMLEHMMFKGTKRFGPGQLIKLVNDNGGQQNAMTSADYTMYYQKLPVDKLALSFELEADRMHNLQLKSSAYTKEHQVVMEERRMRVDDNPQGLSWERFRATAFMNNPYHHPVIGWMTDIKHLTLEDLKIWYKTWYAPNNAIVVVVGDVKSAQVFNLAKQYFGAVKAGDIPKLKPRTEVASLGPRKVIVSVPAKVPWLVMGYNVPVLKTSKTQTEAYALKVLAAVLDAGSSGRLEKDLVRQQQVAVAVNADYDLYSLHSNVFSISAVPASNHGIKELKQALLAEIQRLQTGLVSKEELQRVKAQIIAYNVYKKDSLMDQAFEIGMPEIVGLSWRDSDAFLSRIEAVTPEQIQAVAKKYFTTQNLSVAVLKPKSTTKGASHA